MQPVHQTASYIQTGENLQTKLESFKEQGLCIENTKSSTCSAKFCGRSQFSGRRRFRRGVIFFQTLSAFGNPLDLFDQSLLLDMLFLGAPQ